MKSVIRSAFDPLPRFPSARVQLVLTLALVAGITLSVLEYLESSRLARTSAAGPAATAGAPAPRRDPAGPRADQTSVRSHWTAVRTLQAADSAGTPSPTALPSGATTAGRPSPMSFRPGEDG